MNKRYVLKNKKRFAVMITVVLLLLFSFVFATTVYGFKEKSPAASVFVKQGDTLWEIASQYKEDTEIRRYIYEVKKLNHLSSSEIFEGMELKLP